MVDTFSVARSQAASRSAASARDWRDYLGRSLQPLWVGATGPNKSLGARKSVRGGQDLCPRIWSAWSSRTELASGVHL